MMIFILSNISLLKEAQPLEAKRMVEMGEEHGRQIVDDDDLFHMDDAGERKLLSRYGIWLLVELCKTQEDVPIVSYKLLYYLSLSLLVTVFFTSVAVFRLLCFIICFWSRYTLTVTFGF